MLNSESVDYMLMSALKHPQYNATYMFDKLPLGTVITNTKGIIIYYNEAQTHIDGLDKNFAIGKTEPEIYDFVSFPDIAQICQKRGRPILGFVWVYRTILGKTINAAYWVFPIFDDNNSIIGSICFTQPLGTNIPEIKKEGHQPIEWPKKTPILHQTKKIIGDNIVFQNAINIAKSTASSPSSVLIAGETGTGKEMFARLIHEASPRSKGPYMAINCAAIPRDLLEGLLFGTTKGSFTGALNRPGLFEEANGGTLYLDEIDSMSLELQPKLLRVLQEMKIRRVGSSEEKKLDVKVLSSAGQSSVQNIINSNSLRPDLFYRLAVIMIEIPALKDRLDDLEALINYFIHKYNTQLFKTCCNFSESVMKYFYKYNWPGNVRELEHLIAGAINLASSKEQVLSFANLPTYYQDILSSEPAPEERKQFSRRYHYTKYSDAETNLPDEFNSLYLDNLLNKKQPSKTIRSHIPAHFFREDQDKFSNKPPLSIKEETELLESERIKTVLTTSGGNVSQAARQLGISRQLLGYKMKKYNIKRESFLTF